jgi:P4 family phage/plasmid primase-like protien
MKDVGFFVGGQFNGAQRLQANMALRSVITLDIDHIDPYDLDEITDVYDDYAFAVHSTAKHAEDTPRLRLVFPLKKDITPDKYEPVARHVASLIGMDIFDDTTFQPARIMYWPAVTIDGDVYKHINEGKPVNAKTILETYADWTDFGEWPHSSRIARVRKPVQQAEDPLTKPGVIGAFCRTFDIHAAIETFELPYEQTEFDNRYSPEGSTGASGAIVYDDVFLYSHHESDVAAQLNLNAFDLVRLHRFQGLVAKESEDDPMGERPSYRAMSQLAVATPQVVAELHTTLADEMEKVDNDDRKPVQQVNGADQDPEAAMLTFRDLRLELNTIRELDDPEKACDDMVMKIAAAALSKSENSRMAGILREIYPDPKPSKKSIEDDIKDAHKRMTSRVSNEGTIVDAERRVIQYALDEHYEGGKTLKRFAGMYWTYDTGLWDMEGDERIDGVLANTIIQLREERPQELAELVATVDDRNTSGWLASLAKVIKGTLAAKESRDDPMQLMRTYPLPIINTRNCELWFDHDGNMKKKHHDPDNFFTTRINCDYKPKAKCPEWDRFCALVFNGASDPDDMQRHLEELLGYTISMSRWLKTWVLFHGPKDTGKSTVADVLKKMLGNSYLGYDLGRFEAKKTNQFTENALVGKLALVDDDFEKSNLLPDGFLKKISEEKSMSTEKKWGDVFQFVSRALPIICSNHWPKTKDLTDALRERALVFPFHYKIAGKERDDERKNAMMKELPGILNRLIAGLVRLRKRGDWDIPMDCAEARENFVAHSNMVALFVRQCVEPAEADLKPADAWNAFEHWSRAEIGHGSHRAYGRNGFYDGLEALLGARTHAGKNQYVFRGWQLQVVGNADEMDDVTDVDDWDDED